MPSRLKDLRLRFPYDDQDFREKYTPGHVSQPSLKYTGDESKGPRAANASLKNNHPVFIFPHHDSDGSQNLFLCYTSQTLPDHLPYLIPEDTYKNTFSYL